MGMNGARVERWSLIACMNTRSESVDYPSNRSIVKESRVNLMFIAILL
jgi:hypothetical protein